MPCYEVHLYCLRDHRIGDGDNAETAGIKICAEMQREVLEYES